MSARVHRAGRVLLRPQGLHLKRQAALPEMQFSLRVRDAQMDALSAAVGPGGVFELRSGPAPPKCESPDSGTLLVQLPLGERFLQPAQGGAASALPLEAIAIGGGVAGHFRVKSADRSACLLQGSVGRPGSGAAMEINFTDFEPDDVMKLDRFALAAGNV